MKDLENTEPVQVEIVPNEVKSIEGKWYDFESKYKIEKAKIDTVENQNVRHTPYKISITIPSSIRRGFHPRDLELLTFDEDGKKSGGSYYYGGMDLEPTRQKHIHQKLRDLRKENFRLKKRNKALEKHFSRTAFDEEQDNWKKTRDEYECEYCGKPISVKISIEGADYVYLEEGVIHLKCSPYMFNSICKSCDIVWAQEDMEGRCEECGGSLSNLKGDKIIEYFRYDAIKKHLPEELRDKVILKPRFRKKK
jgi:hypothetical protein